MKLTYRIDFDILNLNFDILAIVRIKYTKLKKKLYKIATFLE